MAVILQQVVGAAHGNRFYPTLRASRGRTTSTRSRRCAPRTASSPSLWGSAKPWWPAGRACGSVRRHPLHPCSSRRCGRARQLAARLSTRCRCTTGGRSRRDARRSARAVRSRRAERDGTLAAVGVHLVAENDVVSTTASRARGAARHLRADSQAPAASRWPRCSICCCGISADGTSAPVEIEFALALDPRARRAHVRVPAAAAARRCRAKRAELQFDDVEPDALICQSGSVLGNGRLEVCDVVVVDFHRFDRGRSVDVAREVARFNAELVARGVALLLIGVGRWGSSEPFLGIPVSWDEISGAR